MNADYRVTLEMSASQARIVERALDLFTRVGIGQMEIVAEVLDLLHPERFPSVNEIELCRDVLYLIKTNLLLQPRNGNYGIGNKKVHDDVKVSHDLQKVIQQVIARTENHSEWSVWHDGGKFPYGPDPIATAYSTIPETPP